MVMSVHDRLVKSRHAAITKLLSEQGKMRITDLADRFGVSPLTIRRDLNCLIEEGVARRTHGWAEIIDPFGGPIHSNAIMAKRVIARKAALLVNDGDTIFINTSSTALSVIEHIAAQNVTIVTNNGKVLQLNLPPTLSVILAGGEIRLPKWSMAGEFTIAGIKQVSAAKAIMGCSGISAARGLTTLVSHETSVNSLMLERSEKHIIVADSTKIGIDSSFCYGRPDQIDILITDTDADEDELAHLRQAGTRRIVQVDPHIS